MTASTAHLQRPIPVLALIAALIRLRVRREQQIELQLTARPTPQTKETNASETIYQ